MEVSCEHSWSSGGNSGNTKRSLASIKALIWRQHLKRSVETALQSNLKSWLSSCMSKGVAGLMHLQHDFFFKVKNSLWIPIQVSRDGLSKITWKILFQLSGVHCTAAIWPCIQESWLWISTCNYFRNLSWVTHCNSSETEVSKLFALVQIYQISLHT